MSKKKIKSIAVLVMALVIIGVQVFAVNAADSGKPVLSIGDINASAGDTVDVDVSISNNTGFTQAMINVYYPQDAMELVKVTDRGLISGQMHTDNMSLYPYQLTWLNPLVMQDFTVNGTLATLTFKIHDNINLEDTLRVEVKQMITADMKEVEADTKSGSVIIKDSSDVPTNPTDASEPATDEPATDEPATDEPATDEPATDEPATDATGATDTTDTTDATGSATDASTPTNPTSAASGNNNAGGNGGSSNSGSSSTVTPSTGSGSNSSATGKVATGDSTSVVMLVLLLMLSAAATAACVSKRRNRG